MDRRGDFHECRGRLDLADKTGIKGIKERDSSIVSDAKFEQKDDSSERYFEFRSLTEEQKNEFMSSLNADGKQILAEFAGERSSESGESAA